MIVVTGSSGFIGSSIVAILKERSEYDKYGILRVDYENDPYNYQKISPYEFLWDLMDGDYGEHLNSDKIDAIIHMGACSKTTVTDPRRVIMDNFSYSRCLADYCAKHSIRMIYASSAATYGESTEFFDDENLLETLTPINMYAKSKHMFDLYLKESGLLKTGLFVGLKYFNVFGPNEYDKGSMRSFIVNGHNEIQLFGNVRLYTSANRLYTTEEMRRDFIYIKDVVDITLFFLDNPDISGIFNVGSGVASSWVDGAKYLCAAMGKDECIHYEEMPEYLRKCYQYYTKADISKLRFAGYDKEITSFKDAIYDYVKNYLGELGHTYKRL